jgi:hypothetical protein
LQRFGPDLTKFEKISMPKYLKQNSYIYKMGVFRIFIGFNEKFQRMVEIKNKK